MYLSIVMDSGFLYENGATSGDSFGFRAAYESRLVQLLGYCLVHARLHVAGGLHYSQY